ncbi:MAG: DUF4430 domain-containing protein [Solobacterium sp.]|nr:DUF4430 domain-containing protein [Solobacterium sp.]
MKNQNKKTWIAVVVGLLVVAAMYFVWSTNRPATSAGAKSVTVEVKDSEGTVSSYEVHTDSEYLIDVLNEAAASTEFSFEAIDSEYGPYITAVNGETADFSVNQAYWAIYVNGNYGEYGADQQPVNDGDVFQLAYERS